MRWIVGRSLRFRWLVLFAAVALMVLGVSQIPNAKVDVFPEFAPPQVEIQTIALGNSSTEVEELVTVPIEEQLQGIDGVDEIRSKSVAQLSAIRIIFKKGQDELKSRQLVTERIAQVTPTLPTWAAPPFIMPPLSATSRIMKIGLTSKELNLIEMSSIAYWKVRQRILRVPGVAQVNIFGERLQQRHVQVDPAKLAKNGVSIDRGHGDDVRCARRRRAPVRRQLRPWHRRVRRVEREAPEHPQRPADPDAEAARRRPARAKGTARRCVSPTSRVVKEDHQPLWGEGVINDAPGLMLIVQKFRGANTMEVTEGIEDAMKEMQPGLPSVEVDTTIFRPATFIEQSIDNLTRALLIGILLVILIIVAFLFEWRTAFISLIAIPLSLLAAILILDWRDVTINVMVLAGLVVAIGVVVDDAIIDVENIVRRLRQARAEEPRGIDLQGRARRLGRGANRDHLRDRDQHRRRRAGVLPREPVGFVLPAARRRLRPRGAGVDAGRADGHACALPDDAVEGQPEPPGVSAAAGPQAWLRGDPHARHPQAEPGDPGRGRLHRGRPHDLSRRSGTSSCRTSRSATSSCTG